METLRIRVKLGQVEQAIRGLRAADAAGEAARGDLVATGAAMLLQQLKAEAPMRTGRLRRSMAVRSSGSGAGLWGLAYGQMLAGGTRPHEIRPKRGRYLVFERGGRLVFARQVSHPGTRANPFPQRAVRDATPALRALSQENGRRMIRLMTGP